MSNYLLLTIPNFLQFDTSKHITHFGYFYLNFSQSTSLFTIHSSPSQQLFPFFSSFMQQSIYCCCFVRKMHLRGEHPIVFTSLSLSINFSRQIKGEAGADRLKCSVLVHAELVVGQEVAVAPLSGQFYKQILLVKKRLQFYF